VHVAHVPNDLTKSKKQDRHHSSPQASDSSSIVLECVEPKRLGMLFFIYHQLPVWTCKHAHPCARGQGSKS